MTVGVLIVCVAGPCSLFFGFFALPMLFDPSAVHIGSGILMMIAIFGGGPLLLGVLLIRSGRKKLRRTPIKMNVSEEHR